MQLRRAVNYEFFMSMFHGESPMHFATTAMVNGPLSLEQIQAAGLKLQQRHPLLRAKVVFDEHGDPWMAQGQVPEIPIEEVQGSWGCCEIESNGKEDHWTAILERELPVFFDLQKGPFVRFIWL
nr:hypothetical protein [Spirochaetaceae bacterium]